MKGGFMNYKLIIIPALLPDDRHKIEDTLKDLGYNVSGGGQMLDGTKCDISFKKEE